MSSKYPLSIEDFAALAWECMEQKYPAETENINLLEAVHALQFEVSELIHNEKLYQYDMVPNYECGGEIVRYKVVET